MNEIHPADELCFDIEAAGFGTHHAFFRKLVKRVAELPGVKACFGFQSGNRRPLFAAFDHSVTAALRTVFLRLAGAAFFAG
jgi:hypothetical protein